jgi:hypothetical protein
MTCITKNYFFLNLFVKFALISHPIPYLVQVSSLVLVIHKVTKFGDEILKLGIDGGNRDSIFIFKI